MTEPILDLSETVTSVRKAFDQSFAEPISRCVAKRMHLLAIRVGKDPYFLRVEDLSGISLHRKTVPLTASTSLLAGLVGVKGKLLVVYRLAALLGHPLQSGPYPWVVQCRRDPSIGLCFSDLDGYLEVDAGNLHRVTSREDSGNHVKGFVRDADVVRAVIDVESVLMAISRSAKRDVPSEKIGE